MSAKRSTLGQCCELTVTSSVFDGGAGCTRGGRSEKSSDMGEAFLLLIEDELEVLEIGGV